MAIQHNGFVAGKSVHVKGLDEVRRGGVIESTFTYLDGRQPDIENLVFETTSVDTRTALEDHLNSRGRFASVKVSSADPLENGTYIIVPCSDNFMQPALG